MTEELEVVPDVRPDVLRLLDQLVKEWDQLHQLIVRLVHKPRLYGDAIFQLVPESLKQKLITEQLLELLRITDLWRVVDDHCFLQVPAKNVQILDVITIHTNTVLSE